MDDRQLSSLIRMADEVDRLEQSAMVQSPWARPVRPEQLRAAALRRWCFAVGGLAAAACLAVMAINWTGPTPAAPVPHRISSGELTAPVLPVPIEEAQPRVAVSEGGSVVLTVFQDADDYPSRVELQRPSWSRDCDLSSIDASELIAAGGTECDADVKQRASRVLVIAFCGPSDSLPSTVAEAELLAACLSDGPQGLCGDDSSCYANSARRFLAEGVEIRAATLALR
jgi:hypothetical protein